MSFTPWHEDMPDQSSQAPDTYDLTDLEDSNILKRLDDFQPAVQSNDTEKISILKDSQNRAWDDLSSSSSLRLWLSDSDTDSDDDSEIKNDTSIGKRDPEIDEETNEKLDQPAVLTAERNIQEEKLKTLDEDHIQRVRALEENIRRLEETEEESTRLKQKAIETHERIREENERLKGEVEELKRRLDSTKKETDALKKASKWNEGELKRKLDVSEKKRNELATENHAIETKFALLTAEKGLCLSQMRKFEKSKKEAERTKHTIDVEKEKLQRTIRELEDRVEALQHEVDEEKDQRKSREASQAEKEAIGASQGEPTKMKSNIDSLSPSLAQLERELSSARDIVASQRTSIEFLQQEVDQYKSVINNNQLTITRLTQLQERQDLKSREQERTIGLLQESKSDAYKTIQFLRSQIAEDDVIKDRLRQAIKFGEEEKGLLKKTCEQYVETIESIKKDMIAREGLVATLTTSSKEQEAAQEIHQKQVGELQQIIKIQQNTITSQAETIENYRATRQILKCVSEQQMRILSTEQELSSQLRAAVGTLTTTVKMHEATIADLEGTLCFKEEQLEVTRGLVSTLNETAKLRMDKEEEIAIQLDLFKRAAKDMTLQSEALQQTIIDQGEVIKAKEQIVHNQAEEIHSLHEISLKIQHSEQTMSAQLDTQMATIAQMKARNSLLEESKSFLVEKIGKMKTEEEELRQQNKELGFLVTQVKSLLGRASI